MAGNILSPEEHRQLTTIPTEIDEAELVRYFTLLPDDLARIDPRPQPLYRFDQAAHICLLRWLGWSPVAVDRLPDLARVALNQQLGLSVESIVPPAARTSRLHAERAREHVGWHKFTEAAEHSLREWLEPLAEEHDQAHVLFEAACQYLRREQIVRPGPDRVERVVEAVRTLVKERIAHGIESQLTAAQKNQLDELLAVPAGETKSPLQRFKETPMRASGNELLEVLEKIEALRALGLDVLDLSAERIHPNRVKLLARRAKQRTNWVTAQLLPPQRYLMLVCFLDLALHEYVDLAVAMYVETIQSIFQRAATKRDKEIVERGKSLNDKVIILGRLARLILDESGVPDAELRQAIYHLVPRDRLAHTVHECDEIAQPADFAPLSFAARSYSYLRHFAPRFLSTLSFQAEEQENPLVEAIAFIRAVDGGRQAFEQPPLNFIPWRWKPYIVDENKAVSRPMYELCLHDCLAKAIEHGELWIPDSQSYTSFKQDWIADSVWPEARQVFLSQYPELSNVDTFLERTQAALDDQMQAANRVWPDLQNEVWIEGEKVHLARLEARELPAGVARLQEQLTNLFPHIGIAQLLLEVNHWIGVDRFLTNLNRQEYPVKNLTAKKMAGLMAEGMNIGLQNMSYCVRGMSYADLAGVYDRYFREETLHQAIVAVVNFYHQLPITRCWGDGTASSSDGQIFGVPVKTIHAQYHPESPSRSGRALGIYTHVSDHGIPFYAQVIHHLSQEGAYVLDGLLYHETDLNPHHIIPSTRAATRTRCGAPVICWASHWSRGSAISVK